MTTAVLTTAELKARALARIDAATDEIVSLAKAIYADPESGYHEHNKWADRHIDDRPQIDAWPQRQQATGDDHSLRDDGQPCRGDDPVARHEDQVPGEVDHNRDRVLNQLWPNESLAHHQNAGEVAR